MCKKYSLDSRYSCSKKIRVHLCNLWEKKKILRIVNSLEIYYFPLVSGSTTNLVFNKHIRKVNPCLSVCKKILRFVTFAIRVQKNTIRMVNPLYLCYLWENLKIIRMVNSLDSRYYFPLVSGSTTNLVFKKNPCSPCPSVCQKIFDRFERFVFKKIPSAW